MRERARFTERQLTLFSLLGCNFFEVMRVSVHCTVLNASPSPKENDIGKCRKILTLLSTVEKQS